MFFAKRLNLGLKFDQYKDDENKMPDLLIMPIETLWLKLGSTNLIFEGIFKHETSNELYGRPLFITGTIKHTISGFQKFERDSMVTKH